MKKIMMMLTIVLGMVLTSNGQVQYDKYKAGNISVVVKEGENKGNVYLDLNVAGTVGISIDSMQRARFKTFIGASYTKMMRWDSIANVNNIKEMEMRAIIESRFSGYFLYGNAWKFGTVTLRSYMSRANNTSTFKLYTTKIVANTNQYMKSKSTFNSFTKLELDTLIETLSDDKINRFVNSKNKVSNLFD